MPFDIGYTSDATGETLYAFVQNDSNQYLNPTLGYFTAYTAVADHLISLTEASLKYYSVSSSLNLASGLYNVRVYKQAGGSPASTDPLQCVRPMVYDQSEATEIDAYELWIRISSLGATDLAELLRHVKAIENKVRAR